MMAFIAHNSLNRGDSFDLGRFWKGHKGHWHLKCTTKSLFLQFSYAMYFTWEYSVWIIIITKLVCWLVICFNLLSTALKICFSYEKTFYRTENKKKIHFQTQIWPLLGQHIRKTVVNFLAFYKLRNFWKFSAIMGNLLTEDLILTC